MNDDGSARTRAMIVSICIVVSSIAAGLLFWTHQIWPLLFAAPAMYFLRKNKPSTKGEENRREELSGKSFAAVILLPSAVVLILTVIFLIKWVLPQVMMNWQ